MSEIGFEYTAVDVSGAEVPIYPATSGSLSYDGSRSVSKTLTGLVFLPSELARIRLTSDELHAWMVVDGERHSLGFYSATEQSAQKDVLLDPETNLPSDLHTIGFGDRMARMIRSDGIPQNIAAGFDPSVEAQNLLQLGDIPFSFEGSVSPGGDNIQWDGSVTLLDKVVQLAQLAGHRNPWMNNDGVVCSVVAESPNALSPDIISLSSLNVEGESIVVTENYLTAPNVVIVYGNSAGLMAPVLGRWDAPSIAPHSYANRGYYYTQIVERQGIRDPEHAARVARAIGEKNSARILDFRCERTYLLDGPVVLRYDDILWVVSNWSMDTGPNATMSVSAQELTQEADELDDLTFVTVLP